MRTILLSLVFALSTGCLDEAPQPEQRSGVLTGEPIAQDPTLRDDREAVAEDYNSDITPNDDDQGHRFCETSADCPHDELCNLHLHRCGVIE